MENEEIITANRSDHTSTSRVIYLGPCVVRDVTIAGDTANAACQVYDGESASDELKLHIEALSDMSCSWSPPGGVLFNKGIYIAVNASTSHVTVTYEPVSRKKLT